MGVNQEKGLPQMCLFCQEGRQASSLHPSVPCSPGPPALAAPLRLCRPRPAGGRSSPAVVPLQIRGCSVASSLEDGLAWSHNEGEDVGWGHPGRLRARFGEGR